jgi:DNA-binding GntR family transcriptional regulator
MNETPQTALSDLLRRGIEEDILAGRLAPGGVIDERTLAARYKVSRTPAREALLQLSTMGLVTIRPRQRTRVATIGLGRLVQMIEVMAGLEAQAAQLAARRIDAAQQQRLLEIQDSAAEVVARGDTAVFNEVNWNLHLAIFAASQNAFLAEQARTLRLRLHPYRCYFIRQTGRLRAAHAEHGEIIEAIVNGEPGRAFAAMTQHLSIDSDRLAGLVAQLPEPQDEDAGGLVVADAG